MFNCSVHTSFYILFFLYCWFISERCMKISQYNCEFFHFFYNFYQVLLYLSWSSMVRKFKVLSSWWVTPFTPGPAHLLALQLCVHYVTHSITEGFCFYFDKKNSQNHWKLNLQESMEFTRDSTGSITYCRFKYFPQSTWWWI